MRAIVVRQFGDPDVMKLEDVADPRPGTGEVLVRVRAAGVNPVDTYIRTGTYARKPELPYTPGSDGAGDVLALGDGVTGLRVGDHVYVGGVGMDRPGTYAEMVVVPRESVWPLPDTLDYAQGAAVAVPYATAYRALYDKGQARADEWLLVHGATGSVGSALVQMGVALGMHVIGTAGSETGRAQVEALGAEHVLNHDHEAHFEQARAITGGRGVDLIVELLANVNLGRDLPILAPRGRVVIVGSRGTVEINPRDLMSKDARIEAMILFNASAEEMARIHAGLRAGFLNGSLAPVVGRRFRLTDAPAAHRAVMESDAHGKIVLEP